MLNNLFHTFNLHDINIFFEANWHASWLGKWVPHKSCKFVVITGHNDLQLKLTTIYFFWNWNPLLAKFSANNSLLHVWIFQRPLSQPRKIRYFLQNKSTWLQFFYFVWLENLVIWRYDLLYVHYLFKYFVYCRLNITVRGETCLTLVFFSFLWVFDFSYNYY